MIFKQFLEGKLSQKALKITGISGGDINEVYSIETAVNIFILKMNTCIDFPKMFEKEKQDWTEFLKQEQ